MFCFRNTHHVMFFREFAFCLFMYYAYIDSEVDARAWDEIWKKKVLWGIASRGLKWENKTYKLNMSLHSHIQGPKLCLPGRQCDQKFSSGDQNFITGRQPATCKAGCHCKLSRSEKMIKNWNLEAICQQVSYFLSCWYLFNLKVKRIFLIPSQQLRSIRVARFQSAKGKFWRP